jgi:stage II sporulation protein D
MKYFKLLIIIVIFPFYGFSINFKIGILRNVSIKKVSISVSESIYSLKSNNKILFNNVNESTHVQLYFKNGKIELTVDNNFIGNFDTLKLSRIKNNSGIFKIKGLIPTLRRDRFYNDDLIIFPQKNSISLVNLVDFEKYIMGVLESEVGKGQSKDFYKVHSIISRTYALKNQYKFIHEGFNLTDLVNCQVYKGYMYKDSNIISAVKETKNLILVDENMDYIVASYFSNSGGQTNNVEDVWSKALPYLRSIHDPFSLGGTNYDWEKIVLKSKWLSYLKNKYQYPIYDTISLNAALNFKQDIRHKYLVDWVYQIPLTDIRKDWNLKSTYFSIYDNGEYLTFKGKGFGHGVGLSQEGAMKMIDLGYDFLEVLRFYYTDVHLINIKMKEFYTID